jgi:hypothetical protein
MVRPNGESAHTHLDKWSASKAIIKVRVLVCRSDLSAHFPILPATSFISSCSGAVLVSTSQHGPDYPCVLVGDRNRGPVMPPTLPKLVYPIVSRIGFARRSSNDSTRAVN